MKRVAGILLLSLFLLNTFGYYGFLVLLQGRVSRETTEKIESSPQERGANMILRIPMQLPYPPEWTDYQPTQGELTYQGTTYHMVSTRYLRDTLYVVCIKDPKADAVHNAINDYVKSFSDQPVKTPTGLKLLSHFDRDYITLELAINNSEQGWSRALTTVNTFNGYNFFLPASIPHPPRG